MIESQVPEMADGGYWYVVPVMVDPIDGGKSPGDITGTGWCAWYGTVGGQDLVAIRTPEPVSGLDTVDVPVADVLAAANYLQKPYGRIGGN